MKRNALLFLFVAAVVIVLAACGVIPASTPYADVAPAATQAPAAAEAPLYAVEAPAATAMPGIYGGAAPAAPVDKSQQLAYPTSAPNDMNHAPVNATPGSDVGGGGNSPTGAGKMIVKNAEVKLLVADTDVAISRTTQVIGDVGGYIISSRVWYQDYYSVNLKYAAYTVGVPVDQFENALTRLRGLAIKVEDETATGDDVTNQYVDLQSQLQNLEATRDRIKGFLDQAKTVDEALQINQQLSDIEGQIEQIQGQINYLSNRSAFSTITINFDPQLPDITPTPTLTPTTTPTPVPWRPGDTVNHATKTIVSAYQGIVDFLIWFILVVVPLLAPPILIVWGVIRLLRRRPKA